ncbi:hypothetical protein B0O99DRAFT_733821 [Bisporella sp. PMI_857]|nr:hypothetical protein B0O99DRAFT_733821 [Bisporella sp. PMI_857]
MDALLVFFLLFMPGVAVSQTVGVAVGLVIALAWKRLLPLAAAPPQSQATALQLPAPQSQETALQSQATALQSQATALQSQATALQPLAPKSQAKSLRPPVPPPVPQQRRSWGKVLYPLSGYSDFSLEPVPREISTELGGNSIESSAEVRSGLYAVYLPGSIIRECQLPTRINQGWFYATDILREFQRLSELENKTKDIIIATAKKVLETEIENVASCIKYAVEEKNTFVEDYYTLYLYYRIGDYVEVQEKFEDKWINRGKGIFGCSDLTSGSYMGWVTKKDDIMGVTMLNFSKSDFAQRLWRMFVLDANGNRIKNTSDHQ